MAASGGGTASLDQKKVRPNKQIKAAAAEQAIHNFNRYDVRCAYTRDRRI
jgi:hypothetical protein